MPRPVNSVPSYRHHKQSGQAVATIRQADGRRRDVLLGKYNSPESKAEYERLLAELRASPAARPTAGRPAGLTVNELLLAYLRHADTHYRTPAGDGTGEADNYRITLRVVRALYGPTPAAEFGPLALKAVRQAMIDAGLCRTVVNARVNRVRRVWKWGASEELVPFDAYHRLTSVQGLGKGRAAVRESEPVGPVDPAVVAATLPQLGRHVAAMVRLQLLSGMRPGEVRRLKPAEVDRSGEVWTYTPGQHKNTHRGKPRRVKLGPQAQAVLAPFLGGDPLVPVFSPRRAVAERFAAMREARKSKVPPSQRARMKARPGRAPGDLYTRRSYCLAVERAAKRAGVPHWHPNQLRHATATAIRRDFGLEAAQVLLGHSKADVTQVYAERDDGLAERVAAAVG